MTLRSIGKQPPLRPKPLPLQIPYPDRIPEQPALSPTV